MEDRVFTKFYSNETNRYEDSPQLRARLLKYTEDFFREGFPLASYKACRHALGIDIRREITPMGAEYYVEETFLNQPIGNILDFLTVLYDSCYESAQQSSPFFFKDKLEIYIKKINQIFMEEQATYIMCDNGRVRYYPDEHSYHVVKNVIEILDNPKYIIYLEAFEEVLDEYYKKRNVESPIVELVKLIERFVLTILKQEKLNRLNEELIEKLITEIQSKIIKETYNKAEYEILEGFKSFFYQWVKMCHKYRHGKADQTNALVPKEIFNFLFYTGITVFKFLLELNSQYKLSE